MTINIDERFKTICKQILAEDKSESEWAAAESDDMFQNESYVGGFDADEKAFCFSYYNGNGEEFWFQVTLDEIKKIVNKEISQLNVRPAE